jgi:hypothetical protein
MLAPEHNFKRTEGVAKCSFRCTETAVSRIQGAEIRKRGCRFVVAFTEPAVIRTQDTTQNSLRLAQSSEVNQNGSQGRSILNYS